MTHQTQVTYLGNTQIVTLICEIMTVSPSQYSPVDEVHFAGMGSFDRYAAQRRGLFLYTTNLLHSSLKIENEVTNCEVLRINEIKEL